MAVYDILVKDRNTNMYIKAGSGVATSKKGALTDYFKYMYLGVVKRKDANSIKRYTKIYGNIITRMNFNMDRTDLLRLMSNLHPHIVVPANDFKPISLTESEINNLAKAVKRPIKSKLSEDTQEKVRKIFQEFREDVKANRTATNKPTATKKRTAINKPTATKKVVSKRVVAKKK